MTVNTKPPSRDTGSLIERAAQSFDFGVFKTPRVAQVVASQPPKVTQQPPSIALGTSGSSAPRIESIDRARLSAGGFIAQGAAPNVISEEFRVIKRALMQAAFSGTKSTAIANGRLIMVCSGQPNEGKTFTSVNLALSLAAEQDVEVLLVDADVAKPEILSTLGLPGGAGFMDVLVDPALEAEHLIIQTDVPHLSVLPAGRAAVNDTEALSSARAHEVIQGLIAQNPRRIVVFDSAPVLAASAAAALAHHVGQVLMVVRADQTTEPELHEAIGQLDGCTHINLILNNISYVSQTRKYGTYYGLGD